MQCSAPGIFLLLLLLLRRMVLKCTASVKVFQVGLLCTMGIQICNSTKPDKNECIAQVNKKQDV